MELLFVYADKVAQDAEGNLYIGSAFSQKVFDRYLEHFDHITMTMRKANVSPEDTETLSRMNKLDKEKISVVWLHDTAASIKNYLNPRLRRENRRIIRENITPDRAVIIRAPSGSGTYAAKYCKKIGKPYLVEAVGCPWDSLWNHSLKGKALAFSARREMRRTMKDAPYSVYVTDKFLQDRYPTKGKAAAISDVELQPMDEAVLEARLAKIRNHSGKTKLATAAAVNVAFKGQQFVIEALARLKKQGNTDFEYHMAGGGDNTRLKDLAAKLGVSEQVVFEGSISHDRMFAWLDSMDIYIQPSLQEGLPRAVVEAMSRGLPAIGAKTGGIPELLGNDFIVPRKNSDAIANQLLDLNPEKMEAMARNNFEHAKDFQKELLENRRFDFLADFAAAAKGENT